jgi:two-component system, OmpR family, response regulator MtrA
MLAGMKSRVLVVDDDPALAEMLTIVLRGEGFDTAVVGDGTRALPAVRELRPDVVLLDLMLPGMNGIDVCRAIRSESGVPIVMLTAKSDTVDVVLGLESGADDYVVKPFTFEVLLARVRVLLRRAQHEATPALRFADLSLDVSAHQVRRGQRELALTNLEFKLLQALMEHPSQVLSKDILLERVWGYDFGGSTNVVEVYIKQLRQKLDAGGAPPIIQTVRGVGYVLREE